MKEGSGGASAALNMSPAVCLFFSALLQEAAYLTSNRQPSFSTFLRCFFEQPNFSGLQCMGVEGLLLWKRETFWAATSRRAPATKSRHFWTRRQLSMRSREVQKLSSASLVHTIKPLWKGNRLPTCQFWHQHPVSCLYFSMLIAWKGGG